MNVYTVEHRDDYEAWLKNGEEFAGVGYESPEDHTADRCLAPLLDELNRLSDELAYIAEKLRSIGGNND
jgi:hypothetical protein